MSVEPRFSPDPGTFEAVLEVRLRQAAAAFPYPPTPDLASRERGRIQGAAASATTAAARRARLRPVWAAAALALLLVGLMMVTPVRARVLEWIRVGAVRIFFSQPTPTPVIPTGMPAPAVTPTVTPTVLQSVLDLAGETTLADAQQRAPFPIRLPASPADLGPPDRVFLQELRGTAVILVWTDRQVPGKVKLVLSESSSDYMLFEKYEPASLQNVKVDEFDGVWVEGGYLLITRSGEVTFTRLVSQGHTLIWSTGDMTFRMETDMDLETALQTAESIR